MTISFHTGNLLDDTALLLVNTVNCVGVMGKGIALQFKARFPDMYLEYRQDCNGHRIKPGHVYLYDQSPNVKLQKIACFTTKDHWRQPSQMKWIETGLEDLIRLMQQSGLKSVALPPLGCGNGGLNWEEVRRLIVKAFSPYTELDVRIYGPAPKNETK